MNSRELERIRQKVERGEVLSDAELAGLEGAASGEAGFALRLTLAHAWLNADQERQAVPLLEQLARDFSGEVQVHLGLARAYFGIDRFADAERAAKRALEANPGDMEAEKSLAIIALRRGEFRRARQLAQAVIDRDPFDTEARLIRDELEQVDPAPPPARVTLRPEFEAGLHAALEARHAKFALRGDELLLETGRRLARVDLSSLYRSFLSEPSEEGAIERIADALLKRGVEVFDAAALERVLPVLRDVSFGSRVLGALRRELPDGLVLYFVADDPELVRYVPAAAAEGAGWTTEKLEARALDNLAQRLVEPVPVELVNGAVQKSDGPTRLRALATGDGSDAARLLLPSQRERLPQEPQLAFLGSRDLVLLVDEADNRARRDLEELRVSRDGIEGLWRVGPDGLRRLR